MKKPSEYIHQSPLWFSMVPKHHSLLVTSQAIKFRRNSSEFRNAYISVKETTPNIFMVYSEDFLCTFNLSSIEFEIGYKILGKFPKKFDCVPLRNLIWAKGNSEEYFFVFVSPEVCEDWYYAMRKVRSSLKTDRNVQFLGTLFDLSSVVKKKWAEVTAVFVNDLEKRSEIFLYNLTQKDVKKALLKHSKSFDGKLNCANFQLIASYISDLVMLRQRIKIKLFYTVPMKFVNSGNMSDYMASLKNIDKEEYRDALIRDIHKFNDPLPQLFQLLKSQKLAICYEILEIVESSRKKRVTNELFSNSKAEMNRDIRKRRCERFNTPVMVRERVRLVKPLPSHR